MRYLLNLIYLLVLVIAAPWLIYKALTTGKYRLGLGCKFSGSLPPGARTLLNSLSARGGPLQKCIWFHGVSVGEIHLLRPVIARFRQRCPDCLCLVSTTTDTGYAEACKHFAGLPIIFWPLDFSWAVARALNEVNPHLVVLAEGELWPNFLLAARRLNIPVAVINGRMSPRSAKKYRLFQRMAKKLLTGVKLFAVQTEDYADVFRTLGVDETRLAVTESVKYDGVEGQRDNLRTRNLRRLLAIEPGDQIWIAGSTQAPEEAVVLECYWRLLDDFPALRLFLVPRQKERFDEVAKILERSGQPYLRRSELADPLTDRDAVVLVDSMGELGALWGLADVAFVGGSLDGKRGGQNMIEPAAYGAAVVFGPHVWNFKDTARRLVAEKAAIQINEAGELEKTIRGLLLDSHERERLGQAARQFVVRQQGATDRTVTLLSSLIPSQPALLAG